MILLNKSKKTVSGTLWGSGAKIITLIFPFIIRTIIIRKLGAEYAGLSSLFGSILSVLSLAELGVGSALVYSMYEPVARNDINKLSSLLNLYRKLYLGIGFIVLAIGVLVMPFLNLFIRQGIPVDINLYLLFAIYLFDSVSSYLFLGYRSSILSAYQEEGVNSAFQLFVNCAMYVAQIIILCLSSNYYAYILVMPVASVILNLIKYRYVKRNFPHIVCKGSVSKEEKIIIRKNVFALFLHKIGATVVNSCDNIIISAFMGLTLLTSYNNYYFLISSVTSLVLIVFRSLTAGIGNSLITNSNKKNEQEFFSVFYMNGLIVSVCTVCFFSMYQTFIALWLGEKYLFSNVTMVLFCIYFYIHTIRRTIIMYRDAAGMWEDNQLQPIISGFFNLVSNIVLIQYIGINGIIISTILAMVIIDIPWETKSLINGLFKGRMKKYCLKFIVYLFATIASCIIVFYINKLVWIQSAILELVLECIIAVSVASSVFVLINAKCEEREFVSNKVKQILHIR